MTTIQIIFWIIGILLSLDLLACGMIVKTMSILSQRQIMLMLKLLEQDDPKANEKIEE